MPPDRPLRQTVPRGRTLLVTGLAGVVFAALVFALAANVLRSASENSATAPVEFDVGPADQRRAVIERDGPLLFPDALNRGRDIYVQHLAGVGWRVFEARAPGAPRSCVLRWERPAGRFLDPCTGTAYPADGGGLVSYPTRLDDDGRLRVDLRSPQPPVAG